MTDTNDKEETFERIMDECMDDDNVQGCGSYLDKLKQLHDNDINTIRQYYDNKMKRLSKTYKYVEYEEKLEEKDEEIKQKEFLLCNLKLISKKQDERISELQTHNLLLIDNSNKLDLQIKELQAENEKLKNHIKRCVNKIEINELKRK